MRKLSTWDATAVLMGTIIGSGIFLVPAALARNLPAPGLIVLVWLAGGLLSLLGALTFAELAVARPAAGGQYVYLRDAYGPIWGFLFGWVTFLVIQTGSIAAVSVGFSQYLAAFVPLSPKAIALASITLLTLVNCLSLGSGSRVQNLCTLLKLSAIAALILAGLGGQPARLFPLVSGQPGVWTAFGVALVGVLWAYDGWNSLGYIAEELEDPRRSLPRALVGGVAAVTLVYALATLSCLLLLGQTGMAQAPQDRVAWLAAFQVAGHWGARLMAAGILVSTFGCLNGMILAGPWVYFAMARDGLFFHQLAWRHPSRRTPMVSLLCQGIWSSLLALSGRYDQLFTYVIFVSWLFYAMTAGALFVFRRRHGPPTYQTWGYPFTPALFIALAVALVLNTLWNQPVPSMCGLGLTLAGLPFYVYFRRTYTSASSSLPSNWD
ncbi:MAG: amino acid permease [Vulcanimicrobiota bacterium]